MHPLRSAVFAVGFSAALLAHAGDATQRPDTSLTGRVYPDAGSPTPTFTVERSTRTTGDKSVLTERFKELDGSTAALLSSTYAAGALQSITFEQNQSRETASAVFKDGRVFYTHSDNGSTKTGDQAVAGKWVALSAVPDEIARNWDAVTGGKPLEFAIPVPILRDHFSFTVTKQRTWADNGRRLTEFKMQPSSLLIRMMADAFYYVFDDESRLLVEYRGVTIAKAADNGKLKDLKARIAYAPAGP